MTNDCSFEGLMGGSLDASCCWDIISVTFDVDGCGNLVVYAIVLTFDVVDVYFNLDWV